MPRVQAGSRATPDAALGEAIPEACDAQATGLPSETRSSEAAQSRLIASLLLASRRRRAFRVAQTVDSEGRMQRPLSHPFNRTRHACSMRGIAVQEWPGEIGVSVLDQRQGGIQKLQDHP
jgi:hypothetical protein